MATDWPDQVRAVLLILSLQKHCADSADRADRSTLEGVTSLTHIMGDLSTLSAAVAATKRAPSRDPKADPELR